MKRIVEIMKDVDKPFPKGAGETVEPGVRVAALDWQPAEVAKNWPEGSVVLIRHNWKQRAKDRGQKSGFAPFGYETRGYFRPDWLRNNLGYGELRYLSFILLELPKE